MERAYDYYREHNSPQAERILTYMENMQACIEERGYKEIHSLAEEIMPEVRKIADMERSQTIKVEKGISK